MTLLIDVGNSAMKWALLAAEGFTARGRAALATLDGDGGLDQCWGALAPPERVLIASVAAAGVTDSITAWCVRHWGVHAENLRARPTAFGVSNAYRDAASLGVDRWLALVAARARSTHPSCVVDCGSALTIDVLDGQGVHLGGLIVPGLDMMVRSLGECAQVRLDGEPDTEISLLARDTVNAVRGGTLYATVAFVDRVLADVSMALGTTLRSLITGGDAPALLPLLQHSIEHAPDLVLEGLAVVAQEPQCVS